MRNFFLNEYPYTDFHEMNLTWVIKRIIELDTRLTEFVSLNTIKYADPIQWDITKQYGTNTVVVDPLTGTAYISSQPVPEGVALTDTNYWSVIFDLSSIISGAFDNITVHNDGYNTDATFNSAVGDWLLVGGRLYEVIIPITIGTPYAENVNIVKKSVEELVKAYVLAIETAIGVLSDLNTVDQSSIVNAINEVLLDLQTTVGDLTDLDTTDQTNIVNAINEVVGNIGDLADLNTLDKSSIVNAINEVNTTGGGALALIGDLNDLLTTDKDTLVDAINEVYNSGANDYVYFTANRLGLDNTGATDCASILGALTDNVGLKPGTYLVDADVTISKQVVFAEGAVLNITSGHTVTFTGDILAGRYQIFDGDGTVVSTTKQSVGFPEWFKKSSETYWETAINKCIVAFHETSLGNRDYDINGTIKVEKSNRKVYGTGQCTWYYASENRRGTRIVTHQATAEAFRIGTTTVPSGINLSTQNVEVYDLTITRTSGSAWASNSCAFRVTQALRCKIHDCATKNNDLGCYIQGCTNLHIEHCTFFSECFTAEGSTRTLRHVFIDNSVLSANNIPNVSIYLNDNIMNTGGDTILANSYGITVSGPTYNITDLFIYGNAIEYVNCGVYMEAGNTNYVCNNIHLIHNELDVIRSNGILLQNFGLGSSVIIEDNYVAPADNANGTFVSFKLDNVSGATLTDNCVVSKQYNNTYGIWVASSNCVSCTNNLLQDCVVGYNVTSSARLHIDGVMTQALHTAKCLTSTNMKHSNVNIAATGSANMFTVGYDLDSNSQYNTLDATRMISSMVTKKITENGTQISALGITSQNNNVVGVIAG